jgi:predicted polyphosphate/ATP-dependent NAD kinase
MAIVGIIPNPASGKDIRRLVAHALVVSNRDKANIVRRMLIGLHAVGVEDVRIMPDKFGIGQQAIEDLKRGSPEVVAGVSILDIDIIGAGIDSIRSARLFKEMGAGCILTVGGDGTARVAALGCGDVPLLPVSTGTNNALPEFVEGTIAGLAAGLVANQSGEKRHQSCYRSKRIEVLVNGEVVDQALVDAAAIASSFTGSRAVWEAEQILQIAVTRASPATIGLSAVVGMIQPISPSDSYGAVANLQPGDPNQWVTAPIGPGLISRLPIKDLTRLEPDTPFPVPAERPLMIALDGERELFLKPGDEASICLRTDGPWIVDVQRVMKQAVSQKRFASPALSLERM